MERKGTMTELELAQEYHKNMRNITIQDVIGEKLPTCPDDWEWLKKEFDVLETSIDKACANHDRIRFQQLNDLRRQFSLTDTGYTIIRGY